MPTISFATGPEAHVPLVDPIAASALGARYISFDEAARFLAQTADMPLGLIAWPGGALAELREDRYGLEYDGLYAAWTGKPGLDEMMRIAIDRDAALAVTLPTIRYVGREDVLATELDAFLRTLLGGGYGPLPRELIFEVGSEFFQYFPGPDGAAQYGAIAALMVNGIARALADPAINTIGADIGIAVQIGRTLAEDDLVRSAMTGEAIASVDFVIHHDFKYQPDNADVLNEDTLRALGAWDAANRAAGGDGTGFFFSAFNIGAWTRAEVLDDWIAQEQAAGNPVTEADVDLDARTNTAFEVFWQDRLAEGAYGLEHATVLLELFSVHAELDAKAAAVFGIDFVHPGRLSWRDADGQDHLFAGGGLVEMLYESVEGTTPLGSEAPYDKDNPATAWAFENDDRLVVFVAAGQRPPGEVTLDLDGGLRHSRQPRGGRSARGGDLRRGGPRARGGSADGRRGRDRADLALRGRPARLRKDRGGSRRDRRVVGRRACLPRAAARGAPARRAAARRRRRAGRGVGRRGRRRRGHRARPPRAPAAPAPRPLTRPSRDVAPAAGAIMLPLPQSARM